MKSPLFSTDFEVRDYECDLQGIVNNAIYQHYLEHARHTFLKTRGIDFARLTAEGVLLIVTRIEIDYTYPLRSRDHFRVFLNLERISRIRFVFNQEIVRLPDEKPIARARVYTASMNERGRPVLPEAIEHLLPDSGNA
ncbi:MAG: acyl-CoA thioesterase [Oceanipulchritudo sp.]